MLSYLVSSAFLFCSLLWLSGGRGGPEEGGVGVIRICSSKFQVEGNAYIDQNNQNLLMCRCKWYC